MNFVNLLHARPAPRTRAQGRRKQERRRLESIDGALVPILRRRVRRQYTTKPQQSTPPTLPSPAAASARRRACLSVQLTHHHIYSAGNYAVLTTVEEG